MIFEKEANCVFAVTGNLTCWAGSDLPASYIMHVRSYLYVSQSTLIMPDEEARVQDIVKTARSRNATLGVTGALMFTETHFAQVLEGPPAAIDALMASIRRDSRHMHVRTIGDEYIPERRFADWTMAYCGPLMLVEDHILPLLRPQPEHHRYPAADKFIWTLRRLVA
jgi:hypothetical protein